MTRPPTTLTQSITDALAGGAAAGLGIGYCFCAANMPLSAAVVAGAIAALVTSLVCIVEKLERRPALRRGSRPLASPPDVTVRALTEGRRCPYCHDDLGEEQAKLGTCVACGGTYHVGCLLELGGCATLGCTYAPRGAARA